MRYRQQSGGMNMLFRPGRPGIGTLIVSVWAGFMVATAGAAIYPPVTGLVTPLVCQGQADTESHHFSTRPGESITTRQFNCIGPAICVFPVQVAPPSCEVAKPTSSWQELPHFDTG